MQFACQQGGRPEIDLSSIFKALSKGTEASLKHMAAKWEGTLTVGDALRRHLKQLPKRGREDIQDERLPQQPGSKSKEEQGLW